MGEARITPLTKHNKLQALDIALQANVGSRLSIIRFLNKGLRQKQNNVFVATHTKEIVGLIGWYQDNGSWAGKSLGQIFPRGTDIYWISYFAIKEKLRGHNMGTQLMQKLIDEVEKKKARELWVYTSRARKFYEKMGFHFMIRTIIEKEMHDFLKLSFIRQD